jgi:glutamyl-tRNA reductase
MILIKMAGIDYHKASVEYREQFSMTSSELAGALSKIKAQYPILGCIIITTCNRTELWISCTEDSFAAVSPDHILCQVRGLSYDAYQPYFTCRNGQDAVNYLMELSSGLHSQIFGDDQIISQVKQAVTTAREQQTTDAVLEVLFRTAITGAKQVKSKVHFTNVNRSVASAAVEFLKDQGICLADTSCLVIGNGEIGRLTASKLVSEGADTFITLRRYKAKDVIIPAGCQPIPYEDRYQKMKNVSVIISATLSPHYTITAEELLPYLENKPKIFIDLAMPRDIDPSIQKEASVTLYDMDTFETSGSCHHTQQELEATEILKAYEQDFLHWYDFREWIPIIEQTEKIIGREVCERVRKELRSYPLNSEEQAKIRKLVRRASAKTTAKLLYGLKDTLPPEELKTVMEAIRKSAEQIES